MPDTEYLAPRFIARSCHLVNLTAQSQRYCWGGKLSALSGGLLHTCVLPVLLLLLLLLLIMMMIIDDDDEE